MTLFICPCCGYKTYNEGAKPCFQPEPAKAPDSASSGSTNAFATTIYGPSKVK